MEVSTHITEDYGENVRNSVWVKLFIFSFDTINGILHIKKPKRVSAIPITHDEDLWQFQEAE